MAAYFRFVTGDAFGQFAYRYPGGKDRRFAVHRFRNHHLLQDVGLVVLVDAQSAPDQLLGHDGSLGHEQDGHSVRNYGDQHQGQDRVVVAGNLEGEDDKGKCGARSRSEYRAHGHQGKCPGGEVRGREDLIHSHGKYSAQRGARHEHGSKQAARRSRTQRNYQGHSLGQHHHDQHLQCEVGIQNVADGVIADAQHPGYEVSDDAESQGPDGGPPELINGQLLEQVFGPVKQLAEANRSQAANHSQQQVKRQGAGDAEIHGRNREHRARAQHLHVDRGGQGAGHNQRDKRSRLELEEQQLDGKNHARNGRIEGRGHAGGRAAGQQHLALRSRGVKDLPYQRSHGAAGLNDGTFGAEGAAGSNRDGGRDGLENRHSRLNAAAIEQHRFHGLGNAVSPDFGRPILRHDS